MSWIYAHPTVAIALISPIFLVIGYIYRARTEKRENLKEALYLLLEIWHRMTILSKDSLDEFFDVYFLRIKAKYPDQVFSEKEIEGAKAHYMPILIKMIRTQALEDFDGLNDAYFRAVKLIAKSDPVYAYRLDSASSTKKRLEILDQCLNEALEPIDKQGGAAVAFSSSLKNSVTSYAEEDSTKELVKNLRGLAIRVGICTFVSVRCIIRRRNKQLKKVDIDEVDKLIDKILTPSMDAINNKSNSTELPSKPSEVQV